MCCLISVTHIMLQLTSIQHESLIASFFYAGLMSVWIMTQQSPGYSPVFTGVA